VASGSEFVISLVDKVSGVVRSMSGSLEKLEGRFKSESKALAQLESGMKTLQKQGVVDIETYKQVQSAIEAKRAKVIALTKDLAKMKQTEAGGGKTASIFGDVLKANLAGAAIKTVASAAAGFVVDGAKMVAQASDFRGDTENVYASMLGSAEAGQATFAKVQALAAKVPESNEVLQQRAQSLLTAGVGSDQLETVLQATSSIMQARGEEGAAALQRVIERGAATGKFTIPEKQLGKLGVTETELIDALGKRLGQGKDVIAAKLKAGKIAADAGTSAISDVLNRKFGGLAEKQLLDFDVQVTKAGDKLKGAFANVNTESFQRAFATVLAKVTDLAVKWLPKLVAWFEEFLIMALNIGTVLVKVFKSEIFQDVAIGIGVVLGLLGAISIVMGIIALVNPFTLIVIGAAALIAIGVAIYRNWGAIVDWFSGLGAKFMSFGHAIIDGLWGGIKSAWGAFLAGFHSLIELLPVSVQKILGVASPSRVFMRIGAFTAQGFAEGIQSGMGAANDAINGLASIPVGVQVRGAAAGQAAAGGAGGRSIVFSPTVNVDARGATDPGAVEEAVRRTVRVETIAIWEQMQIELGAA
jgi:hypothetical protein